MIKKIKASFVEKFNEQPLVFRSPGRVNILGEHTDYNDGFVLPAAIDKYIYVAISKRTDSRICLYSNEFGESFSCDVKEVEKTPMQWPNYILGVVDQLQKKGILLTGFNLLIDGDIPIGAGMSSSAAVECAAIFALNEIFNIGLSRIDLVPLAQKAEHVFAGVHCGIMDQFASMFGKKDQVIKLDCRSLDYEYVPLKLDGYKVVLFNTNVKHNLASSEYNIRRQQCESGVAIINRQIPGVKSLRDVNMEMLEQYVEPVDPLVFQRCKYVVLENERLLGACDDLRKQDLKGLGQKMYQTHQGLSNLYEVSCKELDFLVEFVKRQPGVAGARMMGGGFGGCTINIIEDAAIEPLIESISHAYQQSMNLPLTAYIVSIVDGTEACA